MNIQLLFPTWRQSAIFLWLLLLRSCVCFGVSWIFQELSSPTLPFICLMWDVPDWVMHSTETGKPPDAVHDMHRLLVILAPFSWNSSERDIRLCPSVQHVSVLPLGYFFNLYFNSLLFALVPSNILLLLNISNFIFKSLDSFSGLLRNFWISSNLSISSFISLKT